MRQTQVQFDEAGAGDILYSCLPPEGPEEVDKHKTSVRMCLGSNEGRRPSEPETAVPRQAW